MLRKLTFASRARPGLRATETSDLIRSCRENNATDGISGVLLYTGDSFLELIEGSPPSVASLWRRVLEDPRHRDIVVLFDLQAAERWFEGWRAGYIPERTLASDVQRWRILAPIMPPAEIAAVRALFDRAESF